MKQASLVREVLVKRALRDASLPRDVGDGHRRIAAFRQQRGHGTHEPQAVGVLGVAARRVDRSRLGDLRQFRQKTALHLVPDSTTLGWYWAVPLDSLAGAGRGRPVRTPRSSAVTHDDLTHVHVAIIGSGFSGLGAAIRLKQEGMDDFVVLERADEVGGHVAGQHLPGLPVRRPVASVLVLVRSEPRLEPRLLSAA